ncbi:Nucleoid occlusion factor SlmA [Austwickia sp. TVS 96-490-7B]|uniref:TetR/AcrR family transcriptional regulator n=1 Tax=Austwickia sp. TVS 96-490-7B TaxID=2830843 RepID=UPI001C569A29|nr:TetR/AcrR family transcriptional regulator [Austwickia sp. TVS 96-490-7B]MBW3084207.1 Nucleoid occlusion factor SlmA [Austwickia sp. TVS 96-490-7B]
MGRWDQTHQALKRAAFALFTERGYEATTTAHVAERAGVSEMTLFRHFPTKDALLLADPFDPLMAEAVRARPAPEPPMHALVQGIRQAWVHVDAESARELRDLLRIVAQTPALRGAIERNSNDTAAALTVALVDRGVPEAQARVAVTAVLAGLSTALLDWAQSEQDPLDAALSSALDVLGGE